MSTSFALCQIYVRFLATVINTPSLVAKISLVQKVLHSMNICTITVTLNKAMPYLLQEFVVKGLAVLKIHKNDHILII